MSRELDWQACVNVRDLGGLPGRGGTFTRFGAVIRSDTVAGLTDQGWRELQDYGVTTIVDLRSRDEVAADRPLRDGSDWLVDDVPDAGRPSRPVRTVNVPVLGTWTAELEAHFDHIAGAERDPNSATRAIYMSILDLFSANVAAAVSAIADAPPGGVLVHCQAGKDRTGTICALLLLLVGVAPGEIADDYAQSGPNIAPLHALWVDEAADETERERRRRIGLAPRQAMLDVIAEIEARWGGAEEYLTAAGLPERTVTAVRERLA